MSFFEALSTKQQYWIKSPESLTQRLRTATQGKITHHLFYDNWGNTNAEFRAALKLNQNEKTWIRTMQWQYENVVWMDCTVVIPEKSILNAAELGEIKKQSIGEILFSDPTLKRGDFVFSEKNNGIARYSIFHYKNQPLLIHELFLPHFLNAMEKL